MNILALYLYLINITAFFMMAADKSFARSGARRISEFTFFIMAVIGGGVGIIISSETFSHKTHKELFTRLIPRITLIEALIFTLLFILIGV